MDLSLVEVWALIGEVFFCLPYRLALPVPALVLRLCFLIWAAKMQVDIPLVEV